MEQTHLKIKHSALFQAYRIFKLLINPFQKIVLSSKSFESNLAVLILGLIKPGQHPGARMSLDLSSREEER